MTIQEAFNNVVQACNMCPMTKVERISVDKSLEFIVAELRPKPEPKQESAEEPKNGEQTI